MTLFEKPVRALAPEELARTKRLYESAFPVEERIPWKELLRLADEMPLDFAVWFDGADFVGLTIVWPRSEFDWFWYFAVEEELRGRGLGQEILSRLLGKRAGRTLILDMESPEQECENAEQRRRRHGFYLRNGFRDTGVGKSFRGIDYTILIHGPGTFSMRDYDEIIAELRAVWDAMPGAEPR
ncbi:MAG: GNAT family N-acetyltransferase [Fibrobacterales bacterium]|nr:GNAT family N-acetyltransferase [Fibrobacterales bacterium]